MANWAKVKLEDACSVEWGNSELTKASYIPDGEYLAVSAAGCDGRIGHREHVKNTPVISAIGANCGRMFLPSEDFTAIKNTITITPLEGVSDGRYLYEALTFTELPKRGGAQPFMSKGDIESFKIPLPPLAEQRKIAEILRTWDEAIETAEAELKAKQERKRGVTLKLLNPSGEGAGAVMANWTKVHLGSLVDANVRWSFSGGPFGSNLKASDYTEDGVRIIQLQNIGEGVFNDEYKIFTSESKADDLIANNIYPGEIIFSKMGDPVARACIVPCGAPRYVMASDGIRFKPDPKKADVYFLLNYVNCAAFRKAAESVSSGSTRMRIGLDELRMLEIPLPPLVEQRKIAEVLLSEDEGIDSLKAKANLLRAQKRGLMQKLLTGEVRVAG